MQKMQVMSKRKTMISRILNLSPKDSKYFQSFTIRSLIILESATLSRQWRGHLWKNIQNDALNWIKDCAICQKK